MASQNLRRSKIICTLGPSTSTPTLLKHLIDTGMSVARINFSHGRSTDHQQTFNNISELRKTSDHFFGVALDTKGPEVRIGEIEPRDVCVGDRLVFTNREPRNDEIYFNFMNVDDLSVGYVFSIDDAFLKVRIERVDDGRVYCVALTNHVLKSGKGANFPGICLGLPFLSEKDKSDIAFGIGNDIDFIFASFVSSRADIKELRKYVGEGCDKPLIIAKIENYNAMENLEEIVYEADGVMIARGDLGAEFTHDKLFVLQKKISKVCLLAGKPFIVATQMVETMNYEILPTRAEITDIGNAIFDGCDAVMTSSETATGKYPIEVVKMMADICLDTEKYDQELYRISDVVFRWSVLGDALKVLSGDNSVRAMILITDCIEDIEDVYCSNQKIPVIVASMDINFLRKLSIRKGMIPYKTSIDIWSGDGKYFNIYVDELLFAIKHKYKMNPEEKILVSCRKSKKEHILKVMTL